MFKKVNSATMLLRCQKLQHTQWAYSGSFLILRSLFLVSIILPDRKYLWSGAALFCDGLHSIPPEAAWNTLSSPACYSGHNDVPLSKTLSNSAIISNVAIKDQIILKHNQHRFNAVKPFSQQF